MDSEPRPALRRPLGLLSATAALVGSTIGVGIFLTPVAMAKALGSPGLLLAVWLAMGAMALTGALCLGELAARMPQAGGTYVYLREAFGPGVAFLYGWECLLVMDPGLSSALALGFASYASTFVPGLDSRWLALGAIGLVTLVNLAGIRLAAGLLQWLTLAKVAVLLLLVGFGLFGPTADLARLAPFWSRQPDSPELLPALAGAIVSGFFCFGGWWEATKLGGEIEHARRDLPRALALGVCVLVLLYVAVSAAFLLTDPASTGGAPSLATQAGAAFLGSRGGLLLSGVIAGCVLGSLLGSATMAPRVYYAMAQDGLAPAFVGRVDPRSGAPVGAVLVQGALAALLVVVGSFEGVIAYFVFATVAFIGLTVVGVFVLRTRLGPSPVPAAGFPWTAGYFLVSTALVLALVGLGRPRESALGVLVVLLGWPIYKLRSRAAAVLDAV